jgi:hypothetical protein
MKAPLEPKYRRGVGDKDHCAQLVDNDAPCNQNNYCPFRLMPLEQGWRRESWTRSELRRGRQARPVK